MAESAGELLDMDEVPIAPSAAFRIPGHRALRHMMLPFLEMEGHLLIACADPSDVSGLLAIERITRQSVRAEPAEPESLRRAIHTTYGSGVRPPSGATGVTAAGDEHIRHVDEILTAATLRDASDIHIDPGVATIDVRLRIHGELESYTQLSQTAYAGLLGRIKILARMDIAEKRLPQDGQITHTSDTTGRTFTLRAASIPTPHGEKLTLRLLGNRATPTTLGSLGMSDEGLSLFTSAVSRPNGLVLITGPTGSGKTSTLYAALRHLSRPGTRSIITIEEPIESRLPGVTQIEADSERLTFATALRSILRHDPDIILVGEIRDRETADIALRAALTGHLVLSTLHTRSAAAAVTRLLDLGIEPYLLAASLHLVLAQRLVRRLCRRCARPRTLTDVEAHSLHQPNLSGQTAWEPGGCKWCGQRGWIGRLALFEALPIDSSASRLVTEQLAEESLTPHLRHPLVHDAVRNLLSGQTTYSEIRRALGAV